MIGTTKGQTTATAAILKETPSRNEGRTIFPNPIEISLSHIRVAQYADIEVSFVRPVSTAAVAAVGAAVGAAAASVTNITPVDVLPTWDRIVTIPANTEMTSIMANGVVTLTATGQPFTIERQCTVVLAQDTPAWINEMPIMLLAGSIVVI
jgi:hypothetical protein